jgi:putative endonuclease
MSELNLLHIEDTFSTEKNTNLTGKTGEDLAAQFLVRRGFRLVCSNFKVPIGRNRRGASVTGEIDLIALDSGVLCFIEVKTRSSDEFSAPIAAVDLRKQRQIIRTARIYRRTFDLQKVRFRYDAVTIVLDGENRPKIDLFKHFWTENKFRKKFWNDEIR